MITPKKKQVVKVAQRRHQILNCRKILRPGMNWNVIQIMNWLRKHPIEAERDKEFVKRTLFAESVNYYGIHPSAPVDAPNHVTVPHEAAQAQSMNRIVNRPVEAEEFEHPPQQQAHAVNNHGNLNNTASLPGEINRRHGVVVYPKNASSPQAEAAKESVNQSCPQGVGVNQAVATVGVDVSLKEPPFASLEMVERHRKEGNETKKNCACEQHYTNQTNEESRAKTALMMAIGLGCCLHVVDWILQYGIDAIKPSEEDLRKEVQRRHLLAQPTAPCARSLPPSTATNEQLLQWLKDHPIRHEECNIDFVCSALESVYQRMKSVKTQPQSNRVNGDTAMRSDNSIQNGDSIQNGGSSSELSRSSSGNELKKASCELASLQFDLNDDECFTTAKNPFLPDLLDDKTLWEIYEQSHLNNGVEATTYEGHGKGETTAQVRSIDLTMKSTTTAERSRDCSPTGDGKIRQGFATHYTTRLARTARSDSYSELDGSNWLQARSLTDVEDHEDDERKMSPCGESLSTKSESLLLPGSELAEIHGNWSRAEADSMEVSSLENSLMKMSLSSGADSGSKRGTVDWSSSNPSTQTSSRDNSRLTASSGNLNRMRGGGGAVPTLVEGEAVIIGLNEAFQTHFREKNLQEDESVSTLRTSTSFLQFFSEKNVKDMVLRDEQGRIGNYTGACSRFRSFRRLPHGHGEMKYHSDGTTYKGEWSKGVWHGEGVWSHPDGRKYSGSLVGGQFHGSGTHVFSDGRVYEGEFKDGRGTGHCKCYHQGHTYVGHYLEDKRHGFGTYTWPDGQVYEGYYKDNKRNGRGKLTSPSGAKYKGEFRNNKRHGKGYLTNADGSVEYEGKWVDDKPHYTA